MPVLDDHGGGGGCLRVLPSSSEPPRGKAEVGAWLLDQRNVRDQQARRLDPGLRKRRYEFANGLDVWERTEGEGRWSAL
jgi:hypothetical protein